MNLRDLIQDPFGVGRHMDLRGMVDKAEAQIKSGKIVHAFQQQNKGVVVGSPMPCDTPMNANGGGMGELWKLAAGCRPWGAEAPKGCLTQDGYLRPSRRLCGVVLPYSQALVAATPTDYALLARRWAQPLVWVDASAADAVINSAEFQGTSIWGTANVGVTVNSVFGAGDNTRFVPGLPAIGNTQGDALDFNVTSTAGGTFEGIYIGIAAMPH